MAKSVTKFIILFKTCAESVELWFHEYNKIIQIHAFCADSFRVSISVRCVQTHNHT